MPLSYRELTQPAAEPVTLDQAKAQCRVDFPDDDDLIRGYIVAARQYVEKFTGRNIYNRQMEMTLDYFPWPGWETTTGSSSDSYMGWYFRGLSIRIAKPGTASIDEISYLSDSGETVVIDESKYKADLVSEPARVMPAPGYTWPYQNQYIPGQVKIKFTSGTYGDGVSDKNCPQTIILAILLLVNHFYSNRGATTLDAALKTLPLGVAELLAGEMFITVS